MIGESTRRDNDSVAALERARLWLCWVYPTCEEHNELLHRSTIGRDPSCEVVRDGPGVSRKHAELYRQGPIFAVRDLGSTNGTFLNGKRVEHAPISAGAVLRIGGHVGVFVESVDRPKAFASIAPNLFGGDRLDAAFSAAKSAAPSDLSVVIIGATGTGKERVARAIHELSGRKGPFYAVNCAAMPQSLAEGELFGYRRGAFTGAERPHIGHFRAADGGTLFLDEVAELPLLIQAKLLRVLEERSVTPLGGTDPVLIDVRVVVATQRPLTSSCREKEFREDLLARLAGLTVQLPSLRERIADIPPLFEFFLTKYSGGRPPHVDSKLVECLCLHTWPGNVRELEQLTRRLLAIHGLEPTLKRALLPPELLVEVPKEESLPPATRESIAPDRREHDTRRLADALKKSGGSVASAAELAGFSRQRAYRLLKGQNPIDFANQHHGSNDECSS